jgi:hypothetical protein
VSRNTQLAQRVCGGNAETAFRGSGLMSCAAAHPQRPLGDVNAVSTGSPRHGCLDANLMAMACRSNLALSTLALTRVAHKS